MQTISISVKEAEQYLKDHGRHYKTDAEPICAIGVGTIAGPNDFPELRGAAILGRRGDGDAELAHIYVDGTFQGYSILYGACWRALKALGYKRAVL